MEVPPLSTHHRISFELASMKNAAFGPSMRKGTMDKVIVIF